MLDHRSLPYGDSAMSASFRFAQLIAPDELQPVASSVDIINQTNRLPVNDGALLAGDLPCCCGDEGQARTANGNSSYAFPTHLQASSLVMYEPENEW